MQIAIVDDHPIMRRAVREALGQHRLDVAVVAEASTAREAVTAVGAHGPDVVIMDLLLPGQSGIAATREIHRVSPSCHVLIFTAVTEPSFAVDALSAGATGYALKTQPLDDLLGAIDEVGRGARYLAPPIEEALARGGQYLDVQRNGVKGLSAREREVFDLVIVGYTNRRVAAELYISEKTVETHRTRINRKLGVHSTAELVRFAARHQMIQA